MSHVNYMAHKTYNLISLQICSILVALSALSCEETGPVDMSKWPALFYTSLLSRAVGQCPLGSSDTGGGSCGLAGSWCLGALGRPCVPSWWPAWFPSSHSDSWGHTPFTEIFVSHLGRRHFPLSLNYLWFWVSEVQVRFPARKGKHLVHIQLI